MEALIAGSMRVILVGTWMHWPMGGLLAWMLSSAGMGALAAWVLSSLGMDAWANEPG